MFNGIANFLGSLFGGNQQQKSQPTNNVQPGFKPAPSLSRPAQDNGAAAAEEERRRREEERRRREAEAAAAKQQADAAKQKAAQPKQKTVADNIGDFATGALGFANDVGQGIGEGGTKTFMNTAKFVSNPLRSITDPDAVNKEVDDLYKQKINGRRYADENGLGKTVGQIYGAGVTQALPFFKAGQVVDGLARGSTAFNQLSTAGKVATGLTEGAGNAAASIGLTHVMSPQNMDINTEEGRTNLLWNTVPDFGLSLLGSTAHAARGTKTFADDRLAAEGIGALEATDAAGNTMRQMTSELDQLKNEGDKLPTTEQIDQTANQAGKIDDGIVSPSRSDVVRDRIGSQVDEARQAIQAQYQRTLMGLNQIGDAMTPSTLAPEGIGNPDFTPMDADFVVPEKPVAQAADAADSAPAPEVAPVESPITAQSKEAVESAAPVAPVENVKTKTFEDMTDEEVMQRFKKTKEELRAGKESLAAEKAAEAERAVQKNARTAERIAAAEQAKTDAKTVKTAKESDIFAGKKRTEPTQAKTVFEQPKAEKAPKTVKNDIFEGKKRTETKEAPVTKMAKSAPEAPKKAKTVAAAEDAAPMKPTALRKTGETGKTQGRVGKGKMTYEKVSKSGTVEDADVYAKQTPLKEYAKQLSGSDKNVMDYHIIESYVKQGALKRGDPEYHRLLKSQQEIASGTASDLGSINNYDRIKANATQITANYERKLAGKDINLSKESGDRIEAASNTYTQKRAAYGQAREAAKGKGLTKANVKAVEDAEADMLQADRSARITAYDEALQELARMEKKGQKPDPEQLKIVEDLRRKTGVFGYDAVDSSLLSATGTMVSNFINGLGGLLETSGAGKGAQAIVKARAKSKKSGVYGKTIGGASARGTLMGAKEGFKSIGKEWKLRKELYKADGSNKGWSTYKNIVTSGNELSEGLIRARIQSKTFDHYKQINEAKGMKGEKLNLQSRLDASTDPQDIRKLYADEAYLTQGMSAMSKNEGDLEGSIEKHIRDGTDKWLRKAGAGDSIKSDALVKYASKLTSRFLVGFPKVVWKSGVVAGAKRTPGVGLIIDARRYKLETNPAKKAAIFAEGLEHAASAGTYAALGTYLGATGVITGAYPTDPNEQERWQAEGKTEWSIKLGDDYYDIRKSLGAFALPVMLSAQVGQNMAAGEDLLHSFIPSGDGKGGFTSSPLTALAGVSPVDSPLGRINDINDMLNGEKGWADLAATATRMTVPAAGFINELAKITTAAASGKELEARDKDDQFKEFVQRLAVAVPGGGEALGLEPKQTLGVDQTSTSIIGRLFGAQKGYNAEGAGVVKAKQDTANQQSAGLAIDKATSDSLAEAMDDDTKGLYKRVLEGKQLAPEKLKKVQDAISGMASGDTYKSKYSDSGDWDKQLYVLNTKKQLRDADPEASQSKKDDLNREIKRTQLSKDNGIDAETYNKYRDISQAELKKMLDPEADEYSPEMANKLLAIDKLFDDNDVSRNTDGEDPFKKAKYNLEELAGKGKKGPGMATNVSALKVLESDDGGGGLKYRKTIGGVPNIAASTPKKNFKKTISIKRGVHL